MIDLFSLAPLLLGWLGCFWLCRELAARELIEKDWRFSWGLASVGWGAILTLIVEGCSLARMLNAPALKACWMLVDGTLLGIAATLCRNRAALSVSNCMVQLKRFRGSHLVDWPVEAKWMLGGTVLLVAFLFALAVTTPTTNYDSLTYHLPRVMHWVQQQSVDHFPTNNSRQLEFGPWGAFAMTSAYLLSGSDCLLSLAQWWAMVSTLIVSTLIAQQLGIFTGRASSAEPNKSNTRQENRVAAFTALLVVTLPIGLVESITTQTDYLTTFWLACLVCFTFALIKHPQSPWYALAVGLASGLGVLTKATTFIYAAPLVTVAGGWLLLHIPTIHSRALLVVIAFGGFFVLTAPHGLRNQVLFGSPLGSQYIRAIERNQRISVGATLSNVIRNLALNANSGFPPLTRTLSATLSAAHRLTGQNAQDPATTYHLGSFSLPAQFRTYDSEASNTWHLLLILVAGGIALCRPGRNATLLLYALLIVTSFLLFCALLKWQQWHTRIHLGYFVLFMPCVALILTRSCPRWVVILIAVELEMFAFFCMGKNESRPVLDGKFLSLPREEQYLAVHGAHLNKFVIQIADAIAASKCHHVGLKLGFDDAEYPFWVMLRNRGFQGRIDHFYVEGESARIQTPAPEPCIIITTTRDPPKTVLKAYPDVEEYGYYTLLWAEKRTRSAAASAAAGAR